MVCGCGVQCVGGEVRVCECNAFFRCLATKIFANLIIMLV